MPHAVFFDRDGIVNLRRPDDYVTTWAEFQFLPSIFDALPRVHALGALAILVTNQRGIAIGRMTRRDVDEIHRRMQEELIARCGSRFDDILVCPHRDEDRCVCRKPKPGLLLRAASHHAVSLEQSWIIGDSERDVLAGNAAGCKSILVGTTHDSAATFCCDTLEQAIDIVERGAVAGGNR